MDTFNTSNQLDVKDKFEEFHEAEDFHSPADIAINSNEYTNEEESIYANSDKGGEIQQSMYFEGQSNTVIAGGNCCRILLSKTILENFSKGKNVRVYCHICDNSKWSLSVSLGKNWSKPLQQVLHKTEREGHLDNEAKKYQCDKCAKSFQKKKYLLHHVKIKHEGKRYPCQQCEKTFTSGQSLKLHISAFHGGKRLSCKQCEKTFVKESALQHHVKSIHEGKRWSCKKCDKTYYHPIALSNHYKATNVTNVTFWSGNKGHPVCEV